MSFVDSICVKFLHSSLIIYGKGNRLLLHNEENKTTQQFKPTRDKIHKITYIKYNSNIYKIACSAGREIFIVEIENGLFRRDLSINTKFSDWIMNIHYMDDESIAIITAHNVALLLEVNKKCGLAIKQKLKCDENSTLYCAHIYGNTWKDLIFFCGTALGELIIWRGVHNDSYDKMIAQTVYQKSLHNGVIFSIDYNEGLIATSSDDRSIKIFKPNDSFSILYEQKQLFGHTSRVFACRVIKYDNSIKFLSAGEDANLCVWNEDGTLRIKKNISASGGIWSLDYDRSKSTVVTSSTTGKLNRFQLDKIFFEDRSIEVISPSEKIDPTKLIYLANGTLCVLDSNMQIFTQSSFASKNKWMHVVKIKHEIVAIDAYENRLFLVAKNSILVFDSSNDNSKRLVFSIDMNIVDSFTLPNGICFYFRAIHALSKSIVFISDMHGYCFVVDVELKKLVNLFKIPKCVEPWTTAVTQFQNKFWIVGDRVGSLLLYRNNQDLSTFHLPINKISRLHGQYGVTTIRLLDNGFFKTTSIGGTVKTLFLNEKTESIELYQTEKIPIISVQKIKIYNKIEYILGFNDNYFVICKENEIIYEHRCGGKHRHWDITQIIREDDCKLRFTYINKKQVHSVEFYTNDLVYNTTPDSDNNVFWHLKGCNVIRIINDARILISGGEDTFLKLTQLEMIDNEENDDIFFRNFANVNSHISSIKALETFKENDDLLIVSVGGRAQIVVTRVIKMKYVKEEINFMLTDYYNKYKKGGDSEGKNKSFDPETRFTCVHYEDDKKILIVGCSDGFIRIFEILENEKILSLEVIIEQFYGRCILQLTAIKNVVISMATDGVICFHFLDESRRKMNVIQKLQHNQNGINSFDVLKCEGFYKIATAGDDSGIYVTEFEIFDDCIKFHKTIKSYDVHVAQVTGVKFLSYNEILTCSIDQTVCKLKIIDDKLKIVDKKFTCISDVKGLALLDRKFIFIHGAGLEKLDYF